MGTDRQSLRRAKIHTYVSPTLVYQGQRDDTKSLDITFLSDRLLSGHTASGPWSRTRTKRRKCAKGRRGNAEADGTFFKEPERFYP